MISELEYKYLKLSESQKEIFRGYGLRQIKHFVELSLPKIEALLPNHAEVIGINAEGRIQALNSKTHEKYVWISDQQWQLSTVFSKHIDLKHDFIQIWTLFDLHKIDLIHLSHIHRDFLQRIESRPIVYE